MLQKIWLKRGDYNNNSNTIINAQAGLATAV